MLQNKQQGENHPHLQISVDLYNTIDANSGGLVAEHWLLEQKKVDPEKLPRFVLTYEAAYDMYWEVHREFNRCMINYEKSGQNGSDFGKFVDGDSDILYYYLMLEKHSDVPELQKACREGQATKGGADSGAAASTPNDPKNGSKVVIKEEKIDELEGTNSRRRNRRETMLWWIWQSPANVG